MNRKLSFATAAIFICAAAFSGCASDRDVEVTGTISSASSVQLQGELLLEFYELSGEGESLEQTMIHQASLAQAGDFAETISVEGDKVLIRAIDDRDGNRGCSAGEPWAEVEGAVNDADAIPEVNLVLESKPCPTP